MKLMKLLTRSLVSAALALTAGLASAGIYNFTLTGDYSATWQLDASPTPDGNFGNGTFFINNVSSGNFPGASTQFVDLWFFANAPDGGGGLEIDDSLAADFAILASTIGPQLFTGPAGAPTFTLGEFEMTGLDGTGHFHLTIGTVPEPATLALTIGSLALMAAHARRRPR